MTIEEKLKELERQTEHKLPTEVIDLLIATLRKCREQRNQNTYYWEKYDDDCDADYVIKSDDAELLAILAGSEK